ncbi:MAG: DUF4352 domain-containing protein [Dehalococcoidia bacterium]|jgi:hypothetical protein
MTMARAVTFLVLSGLIMVLGIVLIIVRVNEGLLDSSISDRDSGARVGDNAATPTGGQGGLSPGQAGATATAAIRTVTALAGGRTPNTNAPTPSGRDITQVAIGATTEVNGSRYTVHQVADPEAPGLFTTTTGNRRVALEVTQQAVANDVAYSFANFRLRDANGQEHTWAITNTSPRFESGTLKAGESRRGWISFQVPTGVGIDALILLTPGQAGGTAIVTLK